MLSKEKKNRLSYVIRLIIITIIIDIFLACIFAFATTVGAAIDLAFFAGIVFIFALDTNKFFYQEKKKQLQGDEDE